MQLHIEKLVEGGQGISRDNEKSFFVWGSLPGEEVEVENVNKRKGVFEARASKILKGSPHRIEPLEDHYLSCSPWQIMDFEYENEMKIKIAKETYARIGKLEIENWGLEIESIGDPFGYRNKMEFSFVENEGKISLAFFGRGQKKRLPISGCELATPAINATAKKILAWINSNNLTERNLKAVIIRSNMKGETIAGLFIKDRLEFEKYPDLDEFFLGFNLYYSTHKSPASVITDTLYQEGQDFLIEEIMGKSFKYGLNSFFQVNIPVFEKALKDISDNSQSSSNLNLIDFYSGVGAIGLSVGASVLVESNEEAVGFSEENIDLNNITGCSTVLSPTEKTLDFIEKDKVIIFDPPRAGLHSNVVERILEAKPKKIIYLSCNVATQARDIGLLKEVYDIKSIKLYNFFPRTPHIEGLAVLELKK